MLGITVPVILSFFAGIYSSSAKLIPTEYVDMISTAYLKYKITNFTATCRPVNSDLCDRQKWDVSVNIKVCSMKNATDPKIITGYKQKLDKLVNDVSTKKCRSYEEVEIFAQMDSEPNFECGSAIREKRIYPNWKHFSIEKSDILTPTKWNEDVIIVAIVALLENNCVEHTVLWYFDVFLIPTFGNESTRLPTTNYAAYGSSTITPDGPDKNGTVQNITDSSSKSILLKDDPFLSDVEVEPEIPFDPKTVSLQNSLSLKDANPFDFTSRLYFLIDAHCPKYYYRKGCWKYCKDIPSRLTCDLENGNEICVSGWYHSKVNYLDKNDNSSVIEDACNMMDGCYGRKCKEKCKRTGNGTYTCDASQEPVRFEPSYLTVAPGEVIRCYVDSDDDSKMFTHWQFVLIENFEQNSLSNFITNGEYLNVLPYATPNYNNLMMCLLKDSTNTTLYNTTRNYTIIRYPTAISLNISMQHVYLGDYVQCYSDAWPSDIYKYSFTIPTNNFITFPNNTNGPVLYITKTATLGEMIINCSTFLTDANGTSVLFFRLFRTYIYAIREFRWVYIKRPFYRTNDSFFLVVRVGVEYNLQILQLSGPSVINDITLNEVQFNEACEGGTYKFIATLYIYVFGKFISFHQILEETLFSPPNQIQLSHIDGYPNEKIYCLVDGYPQQLIDVKFVLKDQKDETLLTTSMRRIRLPFDGSLRSTYRISCEYSMLIDDRLYYDSVFEAVIMKVRQKPYKLVFRQYCFPVILILLLILYFFCQFILTVFVLSKVRMLCRTSNTDYIFKTFTLYNKYRKNIRYDEKMQYISDVIFAIQKDLKPGEKLKLATFFDNLKTRYRQSFTKGFVTVPVQSKLNQNTAQDYLRQRENELAVKFSATKTFYGLGPSARHNIAKMYNEI